ncbi:MAG: glycosyltransferase family 4 protein, partial [Anaerolineaceae bacterium]|nr:glycosyltransferase family 4 protein [Anaerolineaceae bacterium]
RAKKKGIRIVQRLNGMNWVHRKTNTGMRHYLRAEFNNWILATIRHSLADGIIYQSHFTEKWWNEVYGKVNGPTSVIYNGVDLTIYSPEGKEKSPSDSIRLLVIEGRFEGGYHIGLDNAIQFKKAFIDKYNRKVELVVIGDAPAALRSKYELLGWISWQGIVARDQIPGFCRSAHLLFSADIKAACPNSVIEALACGLPVISYDTGALKEMVGEKAGAIKPYGADYSELESADPEELVIAAMKILDDQAGFRRSARRQAESMFDVENMVDLYINFMINS